MLYWFREICSWVGHTAIGQNPQAFKLAKASRCKDVQMIILVRLRVKVGKRYVGKGKRIYFLL